MMSILVIHGILVEGLQRKLVKIQQKTTLIGEPGLTGEKVDTQIKIKDKWVHKASVIK